MTALQIIEAGPGVTVQDLGWSGTLGLGLSRGGAVDRLALHEGAALLGQAPGCAAVEMAGFGGVFAVDAPCSFALTGAPMQASVDGGPVPWNAAHRLEPGQTLRIGAAMSGVYGYLHLAGGVQTAPVMESRATHLTAGIGAPLKPGDSLPLGGGTVPVQKLDTADRFSGGTVRMVASVQTAAFTEETRRRFQATEFGRDPRGNRQGMALAWDGASFAAGMGLSLVSEMIVPGDIQIAGDGTPFVLLADCQTTGGYPRIGTVIPADLPRVAQCPAGAVLRFALISLEEALAVERAEAAHLNALSRAVTPLVRAPADVPDLLSYQLISGMVRGDEEAP